ncbi:MAG: amidohydrolase [Filomicrobium sp.]
MITKYWNWLACCGFAAAALASLATSAMSQENLGRLNGTADYAFINGKIYTMNANQPWAEAVAIAGNKITYVGDASGLKREIGYDTEVVDLRGKMMLPGFVDGHIHAVAGGVIMKGLDLQTDDKDELMKRITEYVKANPDEKLIHGYGLRLHIWNDDWPTAAMLDEIESERPLYFWAVDGHKAWVNSKALEIAKITKDTPETVPGFSFFQHDKDGNPTGWVVEIPAQMQVLSVLVDINPDYVKEGVLEWLAKFSAAGLTSVHDYGIQGLSMDEGFQMFKDLETAGKLPLRVLGVYYWNDPNIDPIPIVQKLATTVNTPLIKAKRLKVNMDGGVDSHNALYVDPYSDKPDLKVNPIITYDALNDAIKRADALGIDAVCHCFGDLATRKFLDAVEGAIQANPMRDRRNVVSHGTLVHPDDYARFKPHGVTYDSSGSWMSRDPLIRSISTHRLGKERVNNMFPMKAIADTGANVSFGSDWPVSGYVSEYRPLAAIQRGMLRQIDPKQPPLGGEKARLPLALALKAHTLGAAHGMAMEDMIGSIEIGKMADLVVLEKNLFDIKPEEIADTEVVYTMMNGKLTYDATATSKAN